MIDIEPIAASAVQHIPDSYFGTANLTLTFSVGDGDFEVDPDTGNPIESSSELVIECSVSEDKDARPNPIEGNIGMTVLYLKGRCLNPKILPSTINFTSMSEAVLTNPDDTTVSGNWRFTAIPQNRISPYVGKRGSFIKGILVIPTSV
jgi:hypothetical protein